MPRTSIPRRALSKRAPTCASGAPTWWNNAQGATPCEVYQSILDACGYTVPSISNQDAYYPVTVAQLCMCNTVAYNLGSACQDCQRGTTDQGLLFSWYAAGGDSCPTTTNVLPTSINPAQQIPEWAFQDTLSSFWSYFGAESIANSTATTSAGATATVTHTTATMEVTETLTLSDPTASQTAAPSTTTSKSTNAGAIGGGVAGGVVFLLLLIGLLLFLRRRRAQNVREKADPGMGPIPGRSGSTSSESSLTESGKAPGSSSHYTPHSQMAQLNHSGGSGINLPSHSTSALTTPVDAPPVPSISHEYAPSTVPSRSLATSPTPSGPAVQKVKRVPVRYSEDELARAEEEDKRVAALSSSPPR